VGSLERGLLSIGYGRIEEEEKKVFIIKEKWSNEMNVFFPYVMEKHYHFDDIYLLEYST